MVDTVVTGVNRTWSGSLAASTVTQVEFVAYWQSFEVTNEGTSDIWVRSDGTDPTVAGDYSFLVPASSSATFANLLPRVSPAQITFGATATFTDVRLISTGTPAVTVSVGF